MDKESGAKKIVRFASWMSSFPLEASALRLHEIAWIDAAEGFRFAPQRTKRLLFLYTTDGNGLLHYKGNEHRLKYGDAFIINMNEEFEIHCPQKSWSLFGCR